MGHFFFNFFNPFRYDFVHPSWCDFSFGSSTCTAKDQTIDKHFKNTFEVFSTTHFIYTKYFFCHKHGLWLPNEDFTICKCMYRFCLQRVSMSFSSEITIFSFETGRKMFLQGRFALNFKCPCLHISRFEKYYTVNIYRHVIGMLQVKTM